MKTLAFVLALIALLCGAVVAEAGHGHFSQRQIRQANRQALRHHHQAQQVIVVERVQAQHYYAPAPLRLEAVDHCGGSLQQNGGDCYGGGSLQQNSGCRAFLRSH
jgi:hypothetical protein